MVKNNKANTLQGAKAGEREVEKQNKKTKLKIMAFFTIGNGGLS